MTNIDSPTTFIAEVMDELALYEGQTVVVKIGGNSIDEDPSFLDLLARQLAFLQRHNVRLVVVHGGGPQIDRALVAANLQVAKGADGRRPTTPAMMDIVARVMDTIGQDVATALERRGCKPLLAAQNGGYAVTAKPLYDNVSLDQDRTGMPVRADADALNAWLDKKTILVMGSVCLGPQGLQFNTNADDFAMAVAMALKAHRLVMATNVPGVLDAGQKVVDRLTPALAEKLFENGTIAGGMIPKVQSALRALESDVGGVAIIDAHRPWALLAEMLTRKGVGTLIIGDA